MQVTRVFIGRLMNVAMSTKAFSYGVSLITVVLHIANQIQEVFKTSSAFPQYRRFEARRAVVCCSISLPIKSENCQERRLQVKHFTPSIPDAIYRLRKQKGSEKFDILGEKVVAFLPFAFPPPVLFLYSCSVFWSWEFSGPDFHGKRFGTSRLNGIRRKEVQVFSERFSSSFSAQRYIFLVFLSGLLDLIVLEFQYFYFIILPHRINYK